MTIMSTKQKGKSDWGEYHDGNIFNKHIDQEKKTLVKRIFFTCMEFIQFKLLCFNLICNFDVEKNSLCVYVCYEYTE